MTAPFTGAQDGPGKSEKNDTGPIEHVILHPPFSTDYMCSEHWYGQLLYVGDDLGSDCIVTGGLPSDGKTGYSKLYRTDGKTNEDWFGWMEPVLAPFDGIVVKIHVNPVVNNPGQMGKPPASFVVFKKDDTMVMFGHITDIGVKVGDEIAAGQPFAKVGNNGFSRTPHIHVGAWRNKTPLQVRFDLRAMGKMRKK